MSEARAIHGTLIVPVLCKDGMIICSDRLEWDAENLNGEDTPKVFQISSNACFACTGICAFRHRWNKEYEFDVRKVVKKYFREIESSGNSTLGIHEKAMPGLAVRLAQELNDVPFSIASIPPKYINGWLSICELIFFYSGHQRIEVDRRSLVLNEETGEVGLMHLAIPDNELRGTTPMAFGNRAVLKELLNPTDERFDEVRNDEVIKKFLSCDGQGRDVTKEEAIEFGRRLIDISSTMTALLTKREGAPIGKVIDCALLDHRSGFRWMSDDEDNAVRPEREEDLIALWLQGRTKHTVRSYGDVVRKLRAFIGKPLTLATSDDIVTFAGSLAERAAATRARIIHTINSLFAFGYQHGYLEQDMENVLDAPKGESRVTERILSEAEVMRMINLEPNARNHALLRMLYICGLRVSELVALTGETSDR